MATKKKTAKKSKTPAKKTLSKSTKTKKSAVKSKSQKTVSKSKTKAPVTSKAKTKTPAASKAKAKAPTAAKSSKKSSAKAPVKAPAKVKITGAKGSVSRLVSEIQAAIPDAYAVCLLSGGLVSSVTAALGYRALGDRCKIFLADTGLMRENESKETFLAFKKLGIPVQIINMRKEFATLLKDKKDPSAKKQAILSALYCDTLSTAVKTGRTRHFLHTACADNDSLIGSSAMTTLFKEAGVNAQAPYNQKVHTPLEGLTRSQIAKLGKDCKLPSAIINAAPFAFSALAGRVVGEATTEKIEIIRRITVQIEAITGKSKTEVFPVLADGLVPVAQGNKTVEGYQVEIRAWEAATGKVRKPARLAPKMLDTIVKKISGTTPGVAGVSLNITPLPPACAETV